VFKGTTKKQRCEKQLQQKPPRRVACFFTHLFLPLPLLPYISTIILFWLPIIMPPQQFSIWKKIRIKPAEGSERD
jgi:hypothetical protein